jgi:hypothetical protein
MTKRTGYSNYYLRHNLPGNESGGARGNLRSFLDHDWLTKVMRREKQIDPVFSGGQLAKVCQVVRFLEDFLPMIKMNEIYNTRFLGFSTQYRNVDIEIP